MEVLRLKTALRTSLVFFSNSFMSYSASAAFRSMREWNVSLKRSLAFSISDKVFVNAVIFSETVLSSYFKSLRTRPSKSLCCYSTFD